MAVAPRLWDLERFRNALNVLMFGFGAWAVAENGGPRLLVALNLLGTAAFLYLLVRGVSMTPTAQRGTLALSGAVLGASGVAKLLAGSVRLGGILLVAGLLYELVAALGPGFWRRFQAREGSGLPHREP